jgi:thiamine-phosphate pyrophosphorylase
MTGFDLGRALRLYAITDRTWLDGRALEDVVDALLEGGVTCLQMREKRLTGAELKAQALALKQVCARHGVPFIINDSVELALEVDADGVHVGQKDIQGRDIRALMGPDKIVGMTAATPELARAAQAAGADYIGAGAVFGTATKADAKFLGVPSLKTICAAVDIPVVAIGGIGADNLPQLNGCGAAGAAVVSALFHQADPRAAARRLRALAEEMAGHGG